MKDTELPKWVTNRFDSDYIKSLDKRTFGFAQGFESFFEEQWYKTKNSIIIWHVLSFYLTENLTLPDWIKSYLIDCSTNISKINTNNSKELPDLVYKALKFRKKIGRGSDFQKYKDLGKKLVAFTLVESYLLEHPDSSKVNAFREVSEILNQSDETIKKWYHTADKNF